MPILGSEFRLTEAAHRYILETVEDILASPGLENWCPVISWTVEDLSDGNFVPGPRVTANEAGSGLQYPESFYSVGKFKVFIDLDRKRIQECRDKVLDYRGKRLTLIYWDDLV